MTFMPSSLISVWVARQPNTLGSGESLDQKGKSSTVHTADFFATFGAVSTGQTWGAGGVSARKGHCVPCRYNE